MTRPRRRRGGRSVPWARACGGLALLASLAALPAAGCEDDLTQIVVVVNTDLRVGEEIDVVAVEIDARAAGGERQRFEESLGGASALRLPATLSVVRSDGDVSGPVRVTAEALLGGTSVVRRQAEVRFDPGRSRTLELDLLSCCVGVACGEGQTCGERGCTAVALGPLDLPPWTGTPPPRASCAASDAGPPDDAGDDAAVEPADAAPDARPGDCVPLLPPPRPAGSDDGTGEVRWYAVRTLDVGGTRPWSELGYDFDGRCTTLDSTDLICAPAPGFTPVADGPGGVDNVFAQSIAPLLDVFVPGFFAQANIDLDRGRFGILVRVAGWNGLPDDPLVEVGVVDGVEGLRMGETLGDGGMVAEDASVPLEDGGMRTRSLRWDGTDRWYANEGSFLAGDPATPLTRDRAAYVANGMLVARSPGGLTFTLSAVLFSLPVRLGNGLLLTGRLVDRGRRIEGGTLAGAWAVDDALVALAEGFGICPGTLPYDRYAQTLEHVADLPLSGDPGPTIPCGAFSTGIGFAATGMELAGLAPSIPMGPGCDGDGGLGDGGTSDGDAGVGDAAADGGVPPMDAAVGAVP